MTLYTNLTKASLNVHYLHSNSTTHEFLFGAMAELVDNSRDANAKCLKIYSTDHSDVRGGYALNFLDDGEGMSPEESHGVLEFGRSYKKTQQDLNLIGQYGNGLKSGSMRIGKDVMFFTKKNGIQTVVLLSRTFIEIELDESDGIRVPMPSFYCENLEPCLKDRTNKHMNKDLHDTEINVILKYSPFHSKSDLMGQFDKLGDSGTLVICFNLQLLDNGETEFDIETDPYDIKLSGSRIDSLDKKLQLEHHSFRAYASILYHNPKMKIYIQNKKLQTKILDHKLFFPLKYKYVSKKFKCRDEKEKTNAEERLRNATNKVRDKTSVYQDFQKNHNKKSHEDSKKLMKLKRAKEDADSEYQTRNLELSRIQKNFNEPKSLEFVFGVNVHNRAADGLFIYNCHRLIVMHQHTKQQKSTNEFRGIVGIVDVPRLVLEPTHNKQHFVDKREELILMNELGVHMEYYLKDLKKHINKSLNIDFWRPYGYTDMNFNFLPSDEDQYKRKRIQNTCLLVQCDNENCLKWRTLAWNRKNIEPDFPPDNWQCLNNSEVGKDSCRYPESVNAIETRNIMRSNEQIIVPERRQSTASSNGGGFTLTSINNNVVIDKSVPPSNRDLDQVSRIQKKRNINDTTTESSATDSEMDISTRESRRHDPDPDWRNNRNHNRKKKKLSTDRDEENIPHNIFDNHIIETENIETLNNLESIKPEPTDYTNNSNQSRNEHRISSSNSVRPSGRYSVESGIDEFNLQHSPQTSNSSNETSKSSSKVLYKFQSLLTQLSREMNNTELTDSIINLNESDLRHFETTSFVKAYQEATRCALINETRKSFRKKTKQTLTRKFKMDERVIEDIAEEIFGQSSSDNS